MTMEFRGWRYWTLVAAGALAIALVVADFVLSQTNIAAQAAINQRQQFINQSIELNRVEETLIRAVAIAATRNKDTRLTEVLADQGITVSVKPPDAAPANSAAGDGSSVPSSPKHGARP